MNNILFLIVLSNFFIYVSESRLVCATPGFVACQMINFDYFHRVDGKNDFIYCYNSARSGRNCVNSLSETDTYGLNCRDLTNGRVYVNCLGLCNGTFYVRNGYDPNPPVPCPNCVCS